MLKTTPARIGLSILFLLAANLLSGWLAVELRFPSLWGKQQGIFLEYAIPLPFGWGLAHWLTMLPLALLVSGMPLWSAKQQLRFRLVLAVCLAIAVFIEIDWQFGKLNKIPFTLYPIVDFSIAIALSLCFHTPWKGLFWSAITACGIGITAFLISYLPRSTDQDRVTGVTTKAIEPGFFRSEQIVVKKREKEVQFQLEVRATVEPGKPPLIEEICYNAKESYEQLLSKDRNRDGYHYKVYFSAHPAFEPEMKYIYPAGNALMTSSGVWQCDFSYPIPSKK